jgi:hypothetical protein
MIIVVPTNRSVSLDYLRPLIDSGARFIVVDDSPGSVTVPHPAFTVYSWEDRRRMLGELDKHFPRRNGACRDFGFYVAWCEADPDEIIIALDDDCEITRPDFPAAVEAALSPRAHASWSGAGRHANILELYSNVPDNLYPRGFPYHERVGHGRWQFGAPVKGAASFNLGLWTDAFDVNAIDKISGPAWRHQEAALTHESVAVPRGALVSVCSMNMQFRASVTPAVYQLPMHVDVMPGWVIDRYGDIWGGFVLKMLMDLRGDLMTVGAPMIGHRKAGDIERNTWQEHICHMVNEEFIDLLIAASEDVSPSGYLDMMGALREGIARRSGNASPMLRRYLTTLDASLRAWHTALGRGNRQLARASSG